MLVLALSADVVDLDIEIALQTKTSYFFSKIVCLLVANILASSNEILSWVMQRSLGLLLGVGIIHGL
jgi:hypothetical protein